MEHIEEAKILMEDLGFKTMLVDLCQTYCANDPQLQPPAQATLNSIQQILMPVYQLLCQYIHAFFPPLDDQQSVLMNLLLALKNCNERYQHWGFHRKHVTWGQEINRICDWFEIPKNANGSVSDKWLQNHADFANLVQYTLGTLESSVFDESTPLRCDHKTNLDHSHNNLIFTTNYGVGSDYLECYSDYVENYEQLVASNQRKIVRVTPELKTQLRRRVVQLRAQIHASISLEQFSYQRDSIKASGSGSITFPITVFPRFLTVLPPDYPKQLPFRVALKQNPIFQHLTSRFSHPDTEAWTTLLFNHHPSFLQLVYAYSQRDIIQANPAIANDPNPEVGQMTMVTPMGCCAQDEFNAHNCLLNHVVDLLNHKTGLHDWNDNPTPNCNPSQPDRSSGFLHRLLDLRNPVTDGEIGLRQQATIDEIAADILPYFHNRILPIITAILFGFDHMHNGKGISHSDIKSKNFVMNAELDSRPIFQLKNTTASQNIKYRPLIMDMGHSFHPILKYPPRIIKPDLDKATSLSEPRWSDYAKDSLSWVPIIQSQQYQFHRKAKYEHIDEAQQLSLLDILTPLHYPVASRPINIQKTPTIHIHTRQDETELKFTPGDLETMIPQQAFPIITTLKLFTQWVQNPSVYATQASKKEYENETFGMANSQYLFVESIYTLNPDYFRTVDSQLQHSNVEINDGESFAFPFLLGDPLQLFRSYIPLSPDEIYQRSQTYSDDPKSALFQDIEIQHRIQWMTKGITDTKSIPNLPSPDSNTIFISLKPIASRLVNCFPLQKNDGAMDDSKTPIIQTMQMQHPFGYTDYGYYKQISLRPEFYPLLSPPVSQVLQYHRTKRMCGTNAYLAPEVDIALYHVENDDFGSGTFNQHAYQHAERQKHQLLLGSYDPVVADMFSLGLTFFELIFGQNPGRLLSHQEQYRQNIVKKRLQTSLQHQNNQHSPIQQQQQQQQHSTSSQPRIEPLQFTPVRQLITESYLHAVEGRVNSLQPPAPPQPQLSPPSDVCTTIRSLLFPVPDFNSIKANTNSISEKMLPLLNALQGQEPDSQIKNKLKSYQEQFKTCIRPLFQQLAAQLIFSIFPRLIELLNGILSPDPVSRLRVREILDSYGDLFGWKNTDE